MSGENNSILVAYGDRFPRAVLEAGFWADWLPENGSDGQRTLTQVLAVTLPYGMAGDRLRAVLAPKAYRCPGFRVIWREGKFPEAALVACPDRGAPYVAVRWSNAGNSLVPFETIKKELVTNFWRRNEFLFDSASFARAFMTVVLLVLVCAILFWLLPALPSLSYGALSLVGVACAAFFSAVMLICYAALKQERLRKMDRCYRKDKGLDQIRPLP